MKTAFELACAWWCCSIWKWGHVRVFLRRGAERRPRLHQHPGRSLGRSARCVLRLWRESLGFLWCRWNSHCVETWTATPWPAYNVTYDLFTWISQPLLSHCDPVSSLLHYISDALMYQKYCITCGNMEIFNIPVLTFCYVILPNFHVWCQEVVKFSVSLSLKLNWTFHRDKISWNFTLLHVPTR